MIFICACLNIHKGNHRVRTAHISALTTNTLLPIWCSFFPSSYIPFFVCFAHSALYFGWNTKIHCTLRALFPSFSQAITLISIGYICAFFCVPLSEISTLCCVVCVCVTGKEERSTMVHRHLAKIHKFCFKPDFYFGQHVN